MLDEWVLAATGGGGCRRLPRTAIRRPPIFPANCRALNPSGAVVADDDLTILHDDRYLAPPLGEREHLLQLGGVLLHIQVDRFVPVGRPGRVGIRSAGLAVDTYACVHTLAPRLWFVGL